MIIVIGGTKGGVGKTTIATNLCVMRSTGNNKVLLVDADEQKTASDWVFQRQALGVKTLWTTIELCGKDIHARIKKLSSDYDDIIIDVGGRDTTSQRSALAIADVCVIPFKPKSFDLWSLEAVKTMISEISQVNSKLKIFTVINQAYSRGTDNEDSIQIIKESCSFICIPTSIGNRKSFADASSDGKSIFELKKNDSKAREELNNLYKHLFGINFI